MATRDGYTIGKLLVQKYGWEWATEDDPEGYGDQWVIDPVLVEGVTPYEGLKRQIERQGATDSESPLRELDPLKWAALRAVEFAEAVPADAMCNTSTAYEAWARLRNLAEYAKREGIV